MIKLLIWDLDDTLWRGTLAEGDAVVPIAHRIDMIRAFNERGVVSSICSNNDFEAAKAQLGAFGLWDEFVFPRIAFEPKADAIAAIIADMQLRAANVLFIDDNPVNLNAARFHLPDLNVLDITQAGAGDMLAALLAEQTGTRSRVADYRMLEEKSRDRIVGAGLSNEDFLRSCGIKVCTPFQMENLDLVDRIAELVNRSNQLNYTQSRVTADVLRNDIIDVLRYVSLSIFAWDRYGDYGLVGFLMAENCQGTFRLVHFTFSCRAMHMGLEQYALDTVVHRSIGLYPPIGRLNLPAFEGKFGRDPSDWIEARSFGDPAVQAKLFAHHETEMAEQPLIRIMFRCQSGGIAHYSELRPLMRYDGHPDVFTIRSFHDDSYLAEVFPPFLIYGAGIDYADEPWGDLSDRIDAGLYAACAQRMCDFAAENGIGMLVVLPPEKLAPHQYHPWMGHSLERTQRFNAIWRRAFALYPGISLIEIDLAHGSHEMKDVNHHHPSSLRKIARLVDIWCAKMAEAPEADSETQLAA